MKIIIDNNLSTKLPKLLEEEFPEMIHVESLRLDMASDHHIWETAQQAGCHIITKDSDFRAIQLLSGYPPKIIWLRCGNVKTSFIASLLKRYHVTIKKFLSSPDGAILEIES